MEITSLTNSKVKNWVRLQNKKHRDLEQCFIVEGEHLIKEVYDANLLDEIIVEIGYDNPYTNIDSYEVTPDILNKISSTVSGSKIMGIAHYQNCAVELGNKVVILDHVQDPGNVGTIIRTALSFGYTSVILANDSLDIYNEKLIRSTQGALFHIPVIKRDIEQCIKELQANNYEVYATNLKAAISLEEIEAAESFALVFGNEGQGISPEVEKLVDKNIVIEMNTFESLNVAVAAGICMYKLK
ncbi:MAG: RNA methyltransferase [Erysipelotrichaceae bacterium]